MTVIELRGGIVDDKGRRFRTHPVARVVTDGTAMNTTVTLELADGTLVDATSVCKSVRKEAGSPIVEMTLIGVAPREDIDSLRSFEVSV